MSNESHAENLELQATQPSNDCGLITSHPLRAPCPPALCDCGLAQCLANPGSAPVDFTPANYPVLHLNRAEELRLIRHLEGLQTLSDLHRTLYKMQEQIGVTVDIPPHQNGVRHVRGLEITVQPQPYLCRKTRQSLPAAIRRAMQQHPQMLYDLLDSSGLFAN